MRGLRITKQITVDMSADDWELYSSIPEAEEAAYEISKSIERAYNAGGKRSEVEHSAMAVMRKYAELGAVDSEPLYHLRRILDKLYEGE